MFLFSVSTVAELDALEYLLNLLWIGGVAEDSTMQLARTMPWTEIRKKDLWVRMLQPVESLDCLLQILLRRNKTEIKRVHVFG